MSAAPRPQSDAAPLPEPMLPEALRTPEFQAEADRIFARYPRRINALLSILQHAASIIPLAPTHIAALARLCWATPEQGLLVARAYHLLAREEGVPRVTFCVNAACTQAGGEQLRDTCRMMLHGQPVIVDELVCFGYCTEGPCAEVNGRIVTEATPAAVMAALNAAAGGNAGAPESEDEEER